MYSNLRKEKLNLSVSEALQLMIDFGILIVSLIGLVVVLTKDDKDNKK